MKELKLHKSCSDVRLLKYGFTKRHGNYYKLNLPLYRYENSPVIILSVITSLKDDYIGYDVIDCNSDTLYAAFYDDQEYHKNNKVLQNVNKKLDSIFNEMKTRKIIKGDK